MHVDASPPPHTPSTLQTIVDFSTQPTVVIDVSGKIALANAQMVGLVGYEPSELINKPFAELLPSRFRHDFAAHQRELFAQNPTLASCASESLCVLRNLTTEVPAQIQSQTLDVQGGGLHAVLTISDVTERKRLHRSLGALESVQTQWLAKAPTQSVFSRILEALLEISESEYGFIGEILENEEQRYLKTHAITDIAWNEETRKIYDENYATGMEFFNLQSLFGHVISSGKPVISNNPSADPRSCGIPHGHPALKAFIGIPLYFEGEFIGMAGLANREGGYDTNLMKDIHPLTAVSAALIRYHQTENQRQLVERKLKQREKRFRSLIEHGEDVVCLFSSDAQLLYATPSLNRVLGYSQEAIDRGGIRKILSTPETPFEAIFFDNIPPKFQSQKITHWVTHEDGSPLLVEAVVSNLLEEPSVSAIVWNFHDVTDRENAARLLHEKETQLAHVSRLSTMGEMVAAMAHEVNQPLAAIATFAEACKRSLQSGGNVSDVIEWLGSIYTQSRRCGEIIQNLRGYTTKKEIVRQDVELIDVLEDSVAIVKADANLHSIEIETSCTRPSPTVFGSRTQLQQLVVNILRNAVEASQEAQGKLVTVRAGSHEGQALLEIEDSGHGIDEDLAKKLFEPFFTTKSEGVGLGLAISKTIADEHNGRIWAESGSQLSGTKFSVSIPSAGRVAGAAPPTILVVDDDDAMREAMAAMLLVEGYRVQCYPSAEALLKAHDADSNVLVTDIRLKGMSGLELKEQVASQGWGIPCIFVTGFVEPEQIKSALAAGAIDVLTKPFSAKQFHEAIEKALRRGSASANLKHIA